MRHRLFAGGALSAAAFLLAVISLVWTPDPPGAIDVLHRLQGPSFAHPCGTDPFGRDILSMIMVGSQDALAVAGLAVGIGLVLGVPLGLMAAAWGGWREEAMMRGADFAFAFPALLTAVMVTALSGPGAAAIIIAIAIFTAAVFARVSRTAAGVIWVQDYTRAARAIGRSRLGITRLHVLPNLAGLLVVQLTLQLSLAILAEAALSFLGLGVQPPRPSWGRMLNDAQSYIFTAPGLAIFPGLAIVLTVFGLNLLGDGLRDLLEPRSRRRS